MDNMFEPDQIMDKRVGKHGKVEYLVKWKDFESQSDWTWQAIDTLGCDELIEAYEKKKLKKSKRKHVRFGKVENLETGSQHSLPPSPRSQPLRPITFDDGFEAERILGCAPDEKNGGITFVMKWKGANKLSPVNSKEANVKCPQVVIKFYENHLIWGDQSSKKNSKKIKKILNSN